MDDEEWYKKSDGWKDSSVYSDKSNKGTERNCEVLKMKQVRLQSIAARKPS
jgi:hypothetical protein